MKIMKRELMILCFGIIFFLFMMFSPCLAKADFVPHEAVYELELAEVPKGGLGLTAAGGLMKYKMEKTCEGWLSNTDFLLRLYFDGLGEEKKSWSISSFESFDGLLMEFTSQVFSEGEDTSNFKGRAVFPAKDTEGRAEFSYPEKISVSLPKGTLFPTAFNEKAISFAKEGKKHISSKVFDGSGFDAIAEVNAFISPNNKDWTKNVAGDRTLLRQASYNFAMAFFPYSAKENGSTGLPSYEIKSVVLENGVSAELIQDFGAFKIRSKLKEIRRLPDLKCQ